MKKIKLMESTFYQEKETREKLCRFIQKAKVLSMGEKCEEFEKKFADYQQREFCVLFNSGSSANLALIQALLNIGLIEKGEIIAFSAVTWATNVMPIIELGLVPVPVDVEIDTLNVSSKIFREILSKTTVKALFLTNLLGFCDDVDEIRKICNERNIILLEDNCESLGSTYKGTRLGNFGYASTFSFFVGHHMSTIEGGAVCTDDKEFYNMLLMIRSHGWDRNLDKSKKDELRQKYGSVDNFYAHYTFYVPGYNLRPTEITGFLGLAQLKYNGKINKKRGENFQRFYEASSKNDDFFNLRYNHIEFVSNFAFPIICKSKPLFKKYINRFEKVVEIRPIVGGNILKQPFFKPFTGTVKTSLKNADVIHSQGFYFPNHPELTEDEIQIILSLL